MKKFNILDINSGRNSNPFDVTNQVDEDATFMNSQSETLKKIYGEAPTEENIPQEEENSFPFILKLESSFVIFLNTLDAILRIIFSIKYAYYSVSRHDVDFKNIQFYRDEFADLHYSDSALETLWLVERSVELSFFVLLLFNFIIEYECPISNLIIRDPQMIINTYIFKGTFVFDAVALIPFSSLVHFKNSHMLYQIKVSRIFALYLKTDKNKIVRWFNLYQIRKVEEKCLDENTMYDIENDHIKIHQAILIRYTFNLIRVIARIFLQSYLMGIILFLVFQIEYEISPEGSFMDIYEIHQYEFHERTIIFWYFCFTSITTVGFGDFHPKSSFERLYIAFYLLLNVLLYSAVQFSLDQLMDAQVKLFDDIQDDSSLHKFFQLLKRFNYGEDLNQSFIIQTQKFFAFKWRHDPDQIFKSPKDSRCFMELPTTVQLQLYTNIMQRDFWYTFQKYFQFPNFNTYNKHSVLKLSTDSQYQELMILIFQSLSPICYEQDTLLYDQLESIHIITFVLTGSYDIGINKNSYVLRRFQGSIIGLMEVSRNQRLTYVVRTREETTGLFIRKKQWRKIELKYPMFYKHIVQRGERQQDILNAKLEVFRVRDMNIYRKRADFDHYVTIVPLEKKQKKTIEKKQKDYYEDVEFKKLKLKLTMNMDNYITNSMMITNKFSQKYFEIYHKIQQVDIQNQQLLRSNNQLRIAVPKKEKQIDSFVWDSIHQSSDNDFELDDNPYTSPQRVKSTLYSINNLSRVDFSRKSSYQ